MIQESVHAATRSVASFLRMSLLGGVLIPPVLAQIVTVPPDPGCTASEAWNIQVNPQTDPTGLRNNQYTQTNSYNWVYELTNPGAAALLQGQYPAVRYMSFELFNQTGTFIGGINGASIVPDSGQNNPFVSGSAQGTYTVVISSSAAPPTPAPNTLYTSGQTDLLLNYRFYYPTVPTNVTGGAALPTISINGVPITTCPAEPIISPATSTVWGRLDQTNFVGMPPPKPYPATVALQLATTPPTNPPTPKAVVPTSSTPFFPSIDNSYLVTMLSREYLNSPYTNNLAVIRFMAPTFPNTQAGALASAPGQVRDWTVCTDDVVSTAVSRCAADNESTNVNGFVTFVISDPGQEPSASTLSQWGATWIAWGALESSDVLYSETGNQTYTNANGVFYFTPVYYFQTDADPNWAQSIRNIAQLPGPLQPVAMGAYWPTAGYCTLSAFEALGAGCF